MSSSSPRGPLWWMVKRGNARVFLLGFAEGRANDESGFTPPIRKAFGDSTELWLEVAPAEKKTADDAAYDKLAHPKENARLYVRAGDQPGGR